MGDIVSHMYSSETFRSSVSLWPFSLLDCMLYQLSTVIRSDVLFMNSHHANLFSEITLQRTLSCLISLRANKVSMLTHSYPHKPLQGTLEWSSALARLTAPFTYGLVFALVIFKQRTKSKVIHDAECPY